MILVLIEGIAETAMAGVLEAGRKYSLLLVLRPWPASFSQAIRVLESRPAAISHRATNSVLVQPVGRACSSEQVSYVPHARHFLEKLSVKLYVVVKFVI